MKQRRIAKPLLQNTPRTATIHQNTINAEIFARGLTSRNHSFKAIRENTIFAESIKFRYFQISEIITQIQGRILKRALVLLNCLPFKNWDFS